MFMYKYDRCLALLIFFSCLITILWFALSFGFNSNRLSFLSWSSPDPHLSFPPSHSSQSSSIHHEPPQSQATMKPINLLRLIPLTYLTTRVAALSAAGWRAQSVYQIVTDRFARTDGSTSASCNVNEYCGGTWQGIIHHLDYIQNMGFTAVSVPEDEVGAWGFG